MTYLRDLAVMWAVGFGFALLGIWLSRFKRLETMGMAFGLVGIVCVVVAPWAVPQ